MDYTKLTIQELVDGIKKQTFTSENVVKFFIDRCEKNKHLNAIIEIYDDVLKKAKEIDKKIQQGKKLGALAGVPVAIKDNILYKDKKMSCASKLMEKFVSPYSATIVKKLEAQDAIIFARTNMDEFAMGGSCENSIYGPCKNAINEEYVSGGSSGGSAVAVSAGLVPVAIGTDTGGSIRQPSSFNGVVGIKPTYGTVSRYGIVAFASSTDQASPITKTVTENEFMLKILAGIDVNDGTSIQNNLTDVKNTKKIGIIKQLKDSIMQLKCYPKFNDALTKLTEMGYEIVDIEMPHILNSLACYYIITPAEATSNLARFDGVKYTYKSASAKTLEEVYVKSRSEGFGKEVQRRIMLGNFVLSSGYFDAYYKKAKKLQNILKKEFESAFDKCDAIIMPTTPDTAFKIGGKISDPIAMYLEDLFTVPASLAGIPAISVPYEKAENGLPLGLQLLGANYTEKTLYELSKSIEKFSKWGKE